jgi:hypothetical protein
MWGHTSGSICTSSSSANFVKKLSRTIEGILKKCLAVNSISYRTTTYQNFGMKTGEGRKLHVRRMPISASLQLVGCSNNEGRQVEELDVVADFPLSYRAVMREWKLRAGCA